MVQLSDSTTFPPSKSLSSGDTITKKTSIITRLNNKLDFKKYFHTHQTDSTLIDKRRVLLFKKNRQNLSSLLLYNFTIRPHPAQSNRSQLVYVIVAIFLLLLTAYIQHTSQEQLAGLCPKQCTCDNQNLEIVCKGKLQASSIPHTFNPYTRKLALNYGQTVTLIGVDYMGTLEYLDLAYNRISSVEFDILTKNSNLLSLNISHNNVVELKDTGLMTSLAESNINLSSFNPAIDSDILKRLTKINIVKLDLSQNNVTTLRNLTFIRWHKLQHLDLSYNQISSIEPLALFSLTRLESLNLRRNLLFQIPTHALQNMIPISISTPSNSPNTRSSPIKYLDLSENTFTSVRSNSFSSLENAEKIYLDSCSILNIEEQAFKGLHTLYLLSLDSNHIQEVPSKAFSYIGLLRVLKMNANNLSQIEPASFSSLTNLEDLQLNNGTFRELQSGTFEGLDALKRLELANNRNLTHIAPGTFDRLTSLMYLSLYLNSLSSLTNEFGDSLTILDLRENPLYCGCDLKWLTKWLNKFNSTTVNVKSIYDSVHSYDVTSPFNHTQAPHVEPLLTTELLNLTCSGPPALYGKAVVELPDNKLECLKPASDINVHIGFGMLFLLTFLLTTVCLFNFCRNKKEWLVMLKENLVQNQPSIMISYSENLNTNVDYLKKETQLYGSDYESIDYHNGQIFTVLGEQMQRQNTIGTQQIYQQEI